MTVEAEALGGQIDYGDYETEPRVSAYVLNAPAELSQMVAREVVGGGRMPVVLEAINILKQKQTDLPVVGNLTGPVSLATSLMDPNLFMRLMVKDKPFVKELMQFCTEVIATFGEEQVEAGADVVSIGDPMASGEIVGPQFFTEFIAPSLQEIASRIKRRGGRSILHICGNIESILPYLPGVGADALSFESCMSIQTVRNKTAGSVLMGNVSTFLLAWGPRDSIVRSTEKAMDEGVDIVSPACGLGTGTPAANLRAMTDAVRSRRAGGKDYRQHA
jgi:[methyl-Co(III) methanol-specific corrinoid protein]:coenzyme M methyltransferase